MKRILISLGLATVLATSAAAQGNPGGHFIESWDFDADGQVTLAEATERRGDIFVTFDEDGDGVLIAAEYVAFDEARAADMESEFGAGKGHGHGQGNGGQNASVGMTLAFNDTDGNGSVTSEEFVGQSTAWFMMLDRNADGTITSDDFGRR